jgi:hypothetical protein
MAEQNERAVAASRSALAGLSRPLEEKEGEDLSLSLFLSLSGSFFFSLFLLLRAAHKSHFRSKSV